MKEKEWIFLDGGPLDEGVTPVPKGTLAYHKADDVFGRQFHVWIRTERVDEFGMPVFTYEGLRKTITGNPK
jgi:hypothetical protein